MEFNPTDHIVKLCMQGMHMEETGNPNNAGALFLQAWNDASNEYEKFLSAWFLARHQPDETGKLKWYETALKLAIKINNDAIRGALPFLYVNIAKCYEELGDLDHAKEYVELASSAVSTPSDKGPFYHGTRANLKNGDQLTAGRLSNYKSDLIMNHIYFTASVNGAGLAAALAKGDDPERVFIVKPTGDFEHDPNVTNKKFPGNPTRSYRTTKPLAVIGEVTDWQRQTPEQLAEWREKLAANHGEIIN